MKNPCIKSKSSTPLEKSTRQSLMMTEFLQRLNNVYTAIPRQVLFISAQIQIQLLMRDSNRTLRLIKVRDEKTLDKFSSFLDGMRKDILYHTGFRTLEDIISFMEKKTQSNTIPYELPYRLMKTVKINRRKDKRIIKLILGYKQGEVCNRCNNIFPLNKLTMDHIIPDRSISQLTNLQLLCGPCNEEKGQNKPGKQDISPFKYDGKSCIHRITCCYAAKTGLI